MLEMYEEMIIYFQSDERDNFLHEISENVSEDEIKYLQESNSLNYEYVLSFRKTPLVVLVSSILDFISIGTNSNEKIELLKNFTATALLILVEPSFINSTKRIIKTDFEKFDEIKKYFEEDSLGTVYLKYENLKIIATENTIKLLLKKMLDLNILIKDKKGLYINDEFIVRNIKIKSK